MDKLNSRKKQLPKELEVKIAEIFSGQKTLQEIVVEFLLSQESLSTSKTKKAKGG